MLGGDPPHHLQPGLFMGSHSKLTHPKGSLEPKNHLSMPI